MTDWYEIWRCEGRTGTAGLRTLNGFYNPNRFNACLTQIQR